MTFENEGRRILLYKNRMILVLQWMVLILMSLYVLNAIGCLSEIRFFLGGRRYVNVMWFVVFLYLISSRCSLDKRFFKEKIRLLLPMSVTCIFLNVYHNGLFFVWPVKYLVLFVIAASIILSSERYDIRKFFVVNSLSCLLIFFSALYQIVILKYIVPNGDLNQNTFASMVVMIGNVSVFSMLYCSSLTRSERVVHGICGILAVWVALRTSCRTAFVTEVGVTILFLFLAHRQFKWRIRELALIFLIIVCSLMAVVMTSPAVTETKFNLIYSEIYDFFNLRDNETTASSVGLRLAMWKAAIFDVIPHHFWLGIGDVRQNNMIEIIVKSNIDKDFLSDLHHFHNEGINVFVMGGFVLFCVVNWLWFKLLREARSEPVLLCLWLGTVIYAMTEVVFEHKQFFITFVSMWLLYECATRKARFCDRNQGERRNMLKYNKDNAVTN